MSRRQKLCWPIWSISLRFWSDRRHSSSSSCCLFSTFRAMAVCHWPFSSLWFRVSAACATVFIYLLLFLKCAKPNCDILIKYLDWLLFIQVWWCRVSVTKRRAQSTWRWAASTRTCCSAVSSGRWRACRCTCATSHISCLKHTQSSHCEMFSLVAGASSGPRSTGVLSSAGAGSLPCWRSASSLCAFASTRARWYSNNNDNDSNQMEIGHHYCSPLH